MKLFVWQCTWEKNPTRANLAKPHCSFCPLTDETVYHVLRFYPNAHALWTQLDAPTHPSSILGLTPWLKWNFSVSECWPPFNYPWSSIFAFAIWELWKRRNLWIFQKKTISNRELAQFIGWHAREWGIANKGNVERLLKEWNWDPPPIGTIKINVDASFCLETGKAGLADVCRNGDGIGYRASVRPHFVLVLLKDKLISQTLCSYCSSLVLKWFWEKLYKDHCYWLPSFSGDPIIMMLLLPQTLAGICSLNLELNSCLRGENATALLTVLLMIASYILIMVTLTL